MSEELKSEAEAIRLLLASNGDDAALARLAPLLESHPQSGLLWAFRSRLALRKGDFPAARRFALYGVAGNGGYEVFLALAEACFDGGDPAGAMAVYEFMAHRAAGNVDLAQRAGQAAYHAGLVEKALHWYGEAARRNPDDATPWSNTGYVLKSVGRLEEALAAYEQGLARDGENADLRWNRALLLLTMGRWQEGLAESEWRWKKRDFPSKPRGFLQPLWLGEPVGTLLIHGEQGFGDCLQMLRYVPLAARQVRQVVLEIQPELLRLLQAQAGGLFPANLKVVPQGAQALPPFDAHVPMMSLPLSLGLSDFSQPPTPGAHLHCAPGIVFKEVEGGVRPLNVGIVWRGRPTFPHNKLRSFGLADLAPLFAVAGIRWLSLQKTAGTDLAAELQQAPVPVLDLGAKAQDFYDTASYLRSLDLLITTDTSVAHLAGALGVEAWVAVMAIPDWRWGLEGEQCPWYESVHLFRQQANGDWAPVFAEMKARLQGRVAELGRAGDEDLPPEPGLSACQLGLAARQAGALAESLARQEEAHRAAPSNWGIRVNLAVALQDLGRLPEAIDHFRRAVAQSQAPVAKVNLAMAQLRAGQLAAGFLGFLSRWQVAEWPQQAYALPFPHLREGSALEQPVVLLPDQGYGDTLLALPFMRWFLGRNPGATVVVKKPLVELVRVALGDLCERIGESAQGSFAGWLTGFDLPGIFPQALADYSRERAVIGQRLRDALTVSGAGGGAATPPSLAIVWRGNAAHSLDGWRSIAPSVLAKKLAGGGAPRACVALIPEISAVERQAFAQVGSLLVDFPAVGDFLDTAGHLLRAEGLLAVDTAAVHLAGLLGVPTALLVNALGDWRWGEKGEDSCWYPSVKIFRQEVLGEWGRVVQEALAKGGWRA